MRVPSCSIGISNTGSLIKRSSSSSAGRRISPIQGLVRHNRPFSTCCPSRAEVEQSLSTNPLELGEVSTSRPKFRRGRASRSAEAKSSSFPEIQKGDPSMVDPIHLRDGCQCNQCIDISDRQRNFNFWEIPQDIQIDSCTKLDSGSYAITWKNDIPSFKSHKSTYTPALLKRIEKQYGNYGRYDLAFKQKRQIWDRDQFEKQTQKINYEGFMADGPTFYQAVSQLWQYGLLMLKGVPERESAVEEIATRLGPLYNTFYGPTWDVKSMPQAKNVAYTSKYLGFHMDLLYMKEPPGYQLLHCLHNSCQGGESRFVDTLKAMDILLTEDASHARILHNHQLKYQYSNDDFLYTDVKPILQPPPPGESHQVQGSNCPSELKRIGKVFWSPQFLDTIKGIHTYYHEPATKRFLAAAKRFAELLETPEIVYETKMEPGECAIFANLRVAHARNSFDTRSGKRWLRGAYIREQDVLNKVVQTLDLQRFSRRPEIRSRSSPANSVQWVQRVTTSGTPSD